MTDYNFKELFLEYKNAHGFNGLILLPGSAEYTQKSRMIMNHETLKKSFSRKYLKSIHAIWVAIHTDKHNQLNAVS